MAIRLHRQNDSGTTLVPNEFIDFYMPGANGEFVKIYLYLLRCLYAEQGDLSVCALADLFNNTEKDICRALKYWEKEGLLILEKDEAGTVCGICLCDISSLRQKNASAGADLPDSGSVPSDAEAVAQIPPASAADFTSAAPVQADNTAAGSKPAPPRTLSLGRAEELLQQENIQQLIFIVEQYLGKTLSSTSTNTILYLYDVLHFSEELIEYLVEYCVSRGSRSIRYIEKVGLAWHQEHITTVEQAQESTSTYNKYVFSVLRSFGIKGRNPVASELTYIKKWSSEYGFTIEIISQACERTVTQIHQPSFEYADKILAAWKKQGVKHPADIERLDAARQKTKKTAAKPADSSNKFNNFDQRTYDFKDLERKLLNVK